MKKTVAYCRTALASQSDPLAEVSAQAASLREYARQRGITVDGLYGRRSKRGHASNG